MFFSLDAQSEDNVRWYLENCSMFTVQRANLKMPVCSEELEQQFMAKSLGEVMTITGVRSFHSIILGLLRCHVELRQAEEVEKTWQG